MKNKLLFGAITLGVAAFGLGTEKAQAFDLLPCSSPYVVEDATNCQYTDPATGGGNLLEEIVANTDLSNFSNPTKINVNNVNTLSEGESGDPAEGFFGITKWSFLGKEETEDTTGTLTLSDVISGYNASEYSDLLAVFKGGNGTTVVGYLLGDKTTFQWSASPYQSGSGGDVICTSGCGISHINFYGVKDVPTPAAVLPVLGGLFGAAFRRQKKE